MGKIMMYAGIALIVLAVILTIIFRIKRPVYHPDNVQQTAGRKNRETFSQIAVREKQVTDYQAAETTQMGENTKSDL